MSQDSVELKKNALLETVRNWAPLNWENSQSRWTREISPSPLDFQDLRRLMCTYTQEQSGGVQFNDFDPLNLLGLWCTRASQYTEEKEMPPEDFFLALIRLIDHWAIRRNRRNVNSPYWRADCLKGMFRSVKPDKSKRQMLLKKLESFQGHLLELCAPPKKLNRLTKQIIKQGAKTPLLVEKLETFMNDATVDWAGDAVFPTSMVETLCGATLRQMLRISAKEERRIVQYAMKANLLSQQRESALFIPDLMQRQRLTLEFILRLGDRDFSRKWDHETSTFRCIVQSTAHLLKKLESSRASQKRRPTSSRRNIRFIEHPTWMSLWTPLT